MKRLPQSWYSRDIVAVARGLLGCRIRHNEVILRITEVEAYLGPHDSAAHTRMGRTPRNAPMWGPGGHTYVYLCYGIHNMLNIVAGETPGAAILVRSCEVVGGLATVLQRRSAEDSDLLVAGPGKVGQALALSTTHSGEALFRPGGIELIEGAAPAAILHGPRVGIAYAKPRDQAARLRFADADTSAVTHRRTLKLPR